MELKRKESAFSPDLEVFINRRYDLMSDGIFVSKSNSVTRTLNEVIDHKTAVDNWIA